MKINCQEHVKKLFSPAAGWEPQTWYLVDVKFSSHNPVHKALLFSGFLSEGRPASYSFIIDANGGYDKTPVYEAYFLKPLRKLYSCEPYN